MKMKYSLLIGMIVLSSALAGAIYEYVQKTPTSEYAQHVTTDQTEKEKAFPQSVSLDIGQGVYMEFVRINPGLFTMGSSLYSGEGDEAPEHKVTISEPFYLGKYEVSQEQWEVIMGNNPSSFKGNQLPVDHVSWNDAQLFIDKLQDQTGRTFALPTEAQWEFAAHAGTSTLWDFGDSEGALVEYAWFGENADATTHPVGQKKPNAWGVYDMYGNVQEWCADWYANPYSYGDVSDPQGPESGESRVARGGAWGDDFTMVRSSYRNAIGPDDSTPGTGIRVVMSMGSNDQ